MKIEYVFLMAVGVTVIGAIEIVALCNNIDGVALSAAIGAIVAIITGAPSYLLGKRRKEKEDRHND